jgi:hypothetical protein
MSTPLSVEQLLLQSSPSIQKASRYEHREDENEKMLLDEAELSYNRLVDAITNHSINQIPKTPNDTGLPSERFQVAGIQGIESNEMMLVLLSSRI